MAVDIVQVVGIAVVELDIGVENIVVVVVVPDIVVVVDKLAVVADMPGFGVAGIGSK